MALINCPECNKQVSEHAQTCPNCGFQIERYFYQKAREAKQKEQQETWNKKIAKREKQKQLRIEKFKKHKIKYILISVVSLALVVALIVGSVFLYNKLQIKTFNSESEMKSYVEGVFYDGEPDDFISYKITIKNDYITQAEHYCRIYVNGKKENQEWETEVAMYHISKYDYQNGRIITDEKTIYYKEKDESANDLTSYITKSKSRKTQDIFVIKVNNEIETDTHTYKKQIE